MKESAENKTWRKACLEIGLPLVVSRASLIGTFSLRCKSRIEGSGGGNGDSKLGIGIAE